VAQSVAHAMRDRITTAGADTAHIEPGSPWENGDVEGFNPRMRNELLDGQIFCALREARIPIDQWRHRCNTVRPHSAPGRRPPSPGNTMPMG